MEQNFGMEQQIWYPQETFHSYQPEPQQWNCSWFPNESYNPVPTPNLQSHQVQKKTSSRRSQCSSRKVQQRQAANMRERRRMKTINEAFDNLRTSIPISEADRKLSKVDTLRLAIGYIQHLRDIVTLPESQTSATEHQEEHENKVVITYPSKDSLSPTAVDTSALIGHSLSWEGENSIMTDRKYSAKVWMPENTNLYVGEL